MYFCFKLCRYVNHDIFELFYELLNLVRGQAHGQGVGTDDIFELPLLIFMVSCTLKV